MSFILPLALGQALGHDCPRNPPPQRNFKDKPAIPNPSYQQLQWQHDEMQLFLHFGPNTYTDREWGLGDEDPNLFQPLKLNTTQWVDVAKRAGFGSAILVAKHHDGLTLFPHKFGNHTVAQSSWRNGTGDVVAEFVASCKKLNVRPSIYLSPWDRNYFNMTWDPTYNEFYLNTLELITTKYGPIYQLWWDGANAVPGTTGNYDWHAWYAMLQKNQPLAVAGGCGTREEPDCGVDSQWVGNEDGRGRLTSWSWGQPSVRFPPENPDELRWSGLFCDVSIRPGWFYHASEDDQIRSLADLVDVYFESVGRNCLLQLNIPPNKDGLLADGDVERILEFGNYIKKAFKTDHALNGNATATSVMCGSSAQFAVDGNPDTFWIPDVGVNLATLEVQLLRPARLNVVLLQEHIPHSHVISGYTVEVKGVATNWTLVANGTTIGYKKLDRFDFDHRVVAVRFTITETAYDYPFALQALSLYEVPNVTDSNPHKRPRRPTIPHQHQGPFPF